MARSSRSRAAAAGRRATRGCASTVQRGSLSTPRTPRVPAHRARRRRALARRRARAPAGRARGARASTSARRPAVERTPRSRRDRALRPAPARPGHGCPALTPDVVCRVGELPTSKPLRAWLAGLEVPQIGFSADGAWSDPDSRLSQRSVTPLSELLSRLERDEIVADGSDWLERWRSADRVAAAAIGRDAGRRAAL